MFFLLPVITFFASIVGTIGGFGVSTIMVPVILPFFPLPTTLLLIGSLHLVTDFWKVILFKKGVKLKLALAFGLPGAIAAIFGARLVLDIDEYLIRRLIGLLLILYVAVLFVKPKLKIAQNPISVTGGGVVYGFIAGISGIGGPERSAFLAAFNLHKAVFIATSGLIGIMVDTARVSTYLVGGIRLTASETVLLLILIPITFLGAKTGQFLVATIPERNFRLIISIFLLVIGLKLVIGS